MASSQETNYDSNHYRIGLTYGAVDEQQFTTHSLSVQLSFEKALFKESMWSYRLGAGYARGFERVAVTDTKKSRLNEFTVMPSLNYNFGNLKKVDIQLSFGPFVSYINGSSDRFTGGDGPPAQPATSFKLFKIGGQGIFRLTWYGKRNIHSLLAYTRISTNLFSSIGFGYEIGI